MTMVGILLHTMSIMDPYYLIHRRAHKGSKVGPVRKVSRVNSLTAQVSGSPLACIRGFYGFSFGPGRPCQTV